MWRAPAIAIGLLSVVCGAAQAAIPRAGTILVADLAATVGGGGGALFAVDPRTGKQRVIASGTRFVDPEGVVVEPATCSAIVTDAGAARILRVNLATGRITTIADGPPMSHPVGGVLDERGRLLTSDENAFPDGNGGVIRVDLRTGRQTPVGMGGNFITPLGVALAPNGRTFVADADSFAGSRGGVIELNRATGSQRVISIDPAPGQHPQGILWHGTSLYLSDLARNGIFRVNLKTGVQKAVAVGAPLVSPREVVADGEGGLLTADASAQAVFRIDLRNGAVKAVSAGRGFVAPFGIAVVPECPRARRSAR